MDGTEIDAAARGILQDASTIAFTAADMLIWITAAQLEVVTHAPKSNTVTANLTLTANAHKQALPADYSQLLDITHNMGTGGATVGGSISRTTIERLQASRPDWRKDRATEVRHFMSDERDMASFFVWPASTVAQRVESRLVKVPADVTALATVLEIGDQWKNAVIEYVLHKAYSQNSDSAANREASMLHYAAFARLVGLKLEKISRAGPGANSTTNPAHPAVEKNGA